MASSIEHDLPLVLVEWLDASTDNEPITTESVDGVHRPMVMHTLGWLLKADDIGVTVVNEYYDSTYRGRTFIPAGMIVSVIPYTLSRPRKKKEVRSANETSPD
jgi:hypothetical protein